MPTHTTGRAKRAPLNPRRSQATFSWWPPNCWRIADSTRSAKSSLPRELKREYSAEVSTGVGTPSSIAAAESTGPRPSPIRGRRSRRGSGDSSSAWAVRSSSQDLMTLPRRHTSAHRGRVDLVLVELGVLERSGLGVDSCISCRCRRCGGCSGPRRTRHDPVLDPVVDHLHEVAGAVLAAVEVALLGGDSARRFARASAARCRRRAPARRTAG